MTAEASVVCRSFRYPEEAAHAYAALGIHLIEGHLVGQFSGYMMEIETAGGVAFCVAIIGSTEWINELADLIGGSELRLPDNEVARMFARRRKQMKLAEATDSKIVFTPLHDGARLTADGDLEGT